MVLPLLGTALGVASKAASVGSFVSGLAGLFGGGGSTAAAKQAAAQAAGADARLQRQIEDLIAQLQRSSGVLEDNASMNDMTAMSLLEGFGSAVRNQLDMQDYVMGQNSTNNALALALRDYTRGWDTRNYEDTGVVRDLTLQRQAMADQAEREQRIYELEQIAANKDLLAQERQYAIQQLARERQIAERERLQEGQDIAAYQDGLSREYRDRYHRLTQDRARAQSERDYELQRRDQLMNSITGMREAINRAIEGQGTMTTPELLGDDAIDAESSRRAKVYTDALDRISDRAISMGEAELIRRGVDHNGSADANEARAEILARLAPEYQKAVLQADQEAIGMIGEKNKLRTDKFAIAGQLRDRALAEAQMGASAGLELEASLNPIQSGILDRDIGSAMDYIQRAVSEQGVRGPVDVGSALYDRMTSNSGLAEFLGIPSRQISPSQVSGINTSFMEPRALDAGMFLQGALSSRNNATQALGASANSIQAALSALGGQRSYTQDALKAAQTALGTSRAQQDAGWGNLFSTASSLLGGGARQLPAGSGWSWLTNPPQITPMSTTSAFAPVTGVGGQMPYWFNPRAKY